MQDETCRYARDLLWNQNPSLPIASANPIPRTSWQKQYVLPVAVLPNLPNRFCPCPADHRRSLGPFSQGLPECVQECAQARAARSTQRRRIAPQALMRPRIIAAQFPRDWRDTCLAVVRWILALRFSVVSMSVYQATSQDDGGAHHANLCFCTDKVP